ncbi:MAG: helix-hairpin-helix domain-containing protein [Deltaproteobacteria bacterium]|jgi:comEA protein|nr:helix-hairpin-helix domain-containing protein [Deltaproteobacteria bacterium]MCK5421770.1 helix-hairpin-helix domain-containing protein [Deltaproteobacteria bacterium]NOQ86234.1 competence protein ComEA [Deltaproteobacteria bacterium]
MFRSNRNITNIKYLKFYEKEGRRGFMKLSKLLTLVLALSFFCAFCMVVSSSAAEKAAKAAPEKPVLSGKININTANTEQLEILPRIGTKTAQSIIEYRTQNGPFKKIEDITNVKGIGEKTLEELKGYIILEGNTTLKKE